MAALLANETIPRPAVMRLREAGHDVLHVAQGAAGIHDEDVQAAASVLQRVILTLGRDFGEVIFRHGLAAPPAVIFLRSPMTGPAVPAMAVIDLLSRPDWIAGCFVTGTQDGVRRRRLS